MSYETVVQGSTEKEVKQMADQLIKQADPYRQPFAYQPTQRADGTWICTVHFRGLD